MARNSYSKPSLSIENALLFGELVRGFKGINDEAVTDFKRVYALALLAIASRYEIDRPQSGRDVFDEAEKYIDGDDED